MIALLKYGTGVPFKRLERLQEHLGMPLWLPALVCRIPVRELFFVLSQKGTLSGRPEQQN